MPTCRRSALAHHAAVTGAACRDPDARHRQGDARLKAADYP